MEFMGISWRAVVVWALLAVLGTWYLGREDPALQFDLRLFRSSRYVEKELAKHRDALGDDWEEYKGHVYRVLTYSMHFLDYNQSYLPILERIAVYHDLGLSSHFDANYLIDSIRIAEAHLGHVLSPANMATVRGAISNHHKLLWQSDANEFDEAVINAFRRADWLDSTRGVLRSGMPWSLMLQVIKSLPRSAERKGNGGSFDFSTHFSELFRRALQVKGSQSWRAWLRSTWLTFREVFL